MLQTIKSMPRNIWIIALALCLLQGSMPLLVLISGLLGAKLAPRADLATLPMAIAVVGLAMATIPAAVVAKKLGRKQASLLGMLCALMGTVICLVSTWYSHFYLLLAGTLCIGCSTAFYQQLRFAAIESLTDKSNTGPALSILMMSGIVAGVVGPELVSIGQAIGGGLPEFAPAFGLMALLIIGGMLVFSVFQNPPQGETQTEGEPRPLLEIVKSPLFLTSVCASVVGYAVMAFLMTSTPISMHTMHGHSLAESKWVIQSHIVAMFLPSLFSGFLIKRLGASTMMIAGCIAYLVVIVVATSGQQVVHYWWALVLLGIGWNFLFLSGTTLLPSAYRDNERFKVQAFNDFTIFTTQAVGSLTAGLILFNYGWTVQVLACLPVVILCLITSTIYTMRSRG
ncbi:MFS transporter [Teredinibacter franksiae]|uniref:MFS transporter n=1 Tax=Teredinibacter franksiae TaxID=2761453 RepID=UPI0016262D28|nr:MFS transporter [Teredinibacter franksiae]